jgi:hypothetical protein
VLFLVTLLGAAVMGGVAIANQKATAKPGQQAADSMMVSMNMAQSFGRNFETVRALGMTSNVTEVWGKKFAESLNKSATASRRNALFGGFSRKLYDVGAFGNGSKMKYVANLLVAINNVASAEAMVMGMKAGLDPKVIFEMISNGAGNSRVFELRAPMMVKNDYTDVTMKCSVWQKDMDVIGAFARKMRVPTPLFSATLPVYAAALKSGHANNDTAAVCAVLEAKARIKRRKSR